MSHHTEIVKSLRARGYRLTPQRESVLAVICDSGEHLTADEILGRVRKRYPYLNKSAVYRSLDLLTHLGLVNQTDLGQGRIEFELHRHPHHHHLVCKRCGSSEEMAHAPLRPLEKRIVKDYGFEPDLDHFAIFGLCEACRRYQK